LPRLAIFCLDGLDWDAVCQAGCKFFHSHSKPLLIDTIPNTVPSWVLCFTGRKPEETGIYNIGTKDRLFSSHDVKFPFLWELAEQANLRVIRSSMHLLGLRTDIPYELEILDQTRRAVGKKRAHFALDVTERELQAAWDGASIALLGAAKKGWDLLVSFWMTPDLLGHQFCKDRDERRYFQLLLAFEGAIKRLINELLDFINANYLLISDHGIAAGHVVREGIPLELHKPIGLIGSDEKSLLMGVMSEVFPQLCRFLNLDPTGKVEPADRPLEPGWDSELRENLKALGYL